LNSLESQLATMFIAHKDKVQAFNKFVDDHANDDPETVFVEFWDPIDHARLTSIMEARKCTYPAGF
jgi:hypothetical protein